MMDSVTLFRELGLNNLARLNLYFQSKPGLFDSGSRTIDPNFIDCCNAVRSHMAAVHGIYQRNQRLDDECKPFGTPSGYTFGGYACTDEGTETWVTAQQYLESFALTAHQLPTKILEQFNELASSFITVTEFPQIDQDSNEPYEWGHKTATGVAGYVVPRDVYYPGITEEELRPYRLSDEECRKKYDWMY